MTKRRRSTSPLAFWADLTRASVATAVTLSVRVPQLATGSMSAAERKRMVAEKIAAASEGAAHGAAAAARVARRQARSPAPLMALADLVEIAEAASRPARRRVGANAKRLTKR